MANILELMEFDGIREKMIKKIVDAKMNEYRTRLTRAFRVWSSYADLKNFGEIDRPGAGQYIVMGYCDSEWFRNDYENLRIFRFLSRKKKDLESFLEKVKNDLDEVKILKDKI